MKILHILVAELDFPTPKWWDSNVRRENYASWTLPGLSNLKVLMRRECAVQLMISCGHLHAT